MNRLIHLYLNPQNIPVMIEQDLDLQLVKNSLLYKTFASERDEILRYKWFESEKAGVDIGFEKALLGWLIKHAAAWREQRHPDAC